MKVVTKKGFRDYDWGGTFRYVGDEFEVEAIRGNALRKAGFVEVVPETKTLVKEVKEEKQPRVTKEYKTRRKTKQE